MWKYLKEYKYHNIGIIMLILISDLIVVSLSFVTMRITDLVIQGEFRMLVRTMAFYLAVLEINFLLGYACKVLKSKTIALMNSRMREEISRKLQRKSFQQFAEHDSGEYLSWYTNDIREAENQGFVNFYNCIDSAIKLAAGAVALVFIKIDLLICTLVVAGLSLYLSQRFEKKVEKSSEKVAVALEKFTNTVKQQISGFGMLKSFRRLNKFNDDMCDAGKTMEEQRCSFIKDREKAGIGLGFVNTAGFNLVNVYCYALCALRVIPVESIVGCVNLVNLAGNSFEQLIKTRLLLAGAKPYFKKINDTGMDEVNDEVLQDVSAVKNEIANETEKMTVTRQGSQETKVLRRTEELPTMTTDIKVENLEFAYTDTPILRGLNLDFKIGGKYVIVGKSGCGKSTLLKLLLGQLTNYRGEILFDNKEAGNYITDSFYNQMAYIEQNVFLFNTTIRENITMGDNFTEAEMEEALKKSALFQDLNHFPEGLDTKVGENGSSLSGGQKQRVAIARALIHNRSILIVDEGTSALDQENAAAIEDALLGCEDLTLIIVSHHLREEKRKYYTDVYRLENGRRVTA